MPSVDELTSLFRAISSKDWSSVEEAARAIASREDDRGFHAAARTLRGALATTKGLEARRRLLLYGPPGCGKSMSAGALAKAIGLPLYVVRFDSIITSFLGQTAANLRQLFQFVEQNPCVLLIDELDALGRRRGERMDVGELDRIVISLMQELEHSQPAGILVATCNLPDDLDRALWRRFDVALEFPLPTKNELAGYVREKAQTLGIRLNQSIRQKVAKRISYTEAEKLLEAEARNVALKEL